MTDREKAIVMAYTGKCMLTEDKFHIFHEYIEEIMGRPVFTHELADKDVSAEIKEKAKADFIALCEEEEKEKEPCGDCVSRKELINKLEIVDKMYGSDFYWEMRRLVDKLSPVTPIQKKGKWENKNVNYHHFYGKCSECGQEFCVDTWYTQNMKYCPNCGTKMEEK